MDFLTSTETGENMRKALVTRIMSTGSVCVHVYEPPLKTNTLLLSSKENFHDIKELR